MNNKLLILSAGCRRTLGALVCLVACGVAAAAPTNVPARTEKTTSTNAPALAVIEVPRSEFAIPASLAEGRDPFFPASTRTGAVKVTGQTPIDKPVITLELKGISGKFALINNQTFAAGEEGEVTVGKIKVHIRCVSIKEDSVQVEQDGKLQDLKLRPGF